MNPLKVLSVRSENQTDNMRAAFLLLLGVAATLALPAAQDEETRIVGGSVTTIDQYPFGVALLASSTGSWYGQACGGTILNNRSVLTAAHCFMSLSQAWQWRSRVGSTWASSGGVIFNTNQIINHPNFNRGNLDMDFAVIRISGTFSFNNNVRAGSIAGANYNLADNQQVWAIGWGATCPGCSGSEQLRHVQIWSINQNTCVARYNELRMTITANMLCSGWLDVGGRDQCQGDSGGPLIHNNIVVGVCSWGQSCAVARYPGVNARVSRASAWIVSNA